MRRSWVVLMWVFVVAFLGSMPIAQACNPPSAPEAPALVEAVLSSGDLLFDAYLLDPRPDPLVRNEWRPVWVRWGQLEARAREYREASTWDEVTGEDIALLEAYCAFEEVSPVDLVGLMPGVADEVIQLRVICQAIGGGRDR